MVTQQLPVHLKSTGLARETIPINLCVFAQNMGEPLLLPYISRSALK
jgi:hypothetical protein